MTIYWAEYGNVYRSSDSKHAKFGLQSLAESLALAFNEGTRNPDDYVWDPSGTEWPRGKTVSYDLTDAFVPGSFGFTTSEDSGWVDDTVEQPDPVDMVNHPPHYHFDNGVQVIDLTEQLNFNCGNAVKYIARAGRKSEDPLEDLRKAEFYVKKEIARVERGSSVR